MRAMHRKAPILAWILTGLTCFLIGALVGTGWSQAAALPVFPPLGVVVTVEVAFQATATPYWTPLPTLTPTATPSPTPAGPTPTPLEGGTGNVR